MKELVAANCKIHMRGAVLFFQGIAKCFTLETLNLNGNEFGSAARHNGQYLRQYASQLHEALDDGLTTSLHNVFLNHCGLNDSEAGPLSEAISKHNSTLTNLSLNNNKIKSTGASKLFTSMMSQTSCMVSIDLGFNVIDDKC